MDWLSALLILVVAVAAIYARLAGRTWARDTMTRWTLARRTLEEWDRHWLERVDKSEAVVCLSTIPSRLPLLGDTLKSLLAQKVAPARIRLHLPEFSRREQCAYEVPDWLAGLSSVQIVRTPDWGPATKLIPALRDFAAAQKLIVVDDDMLYPPTLVSDLERHADAQPQAAFGSSGWVVPHDLTDRPTTWWSHLLQRPPAPVLCTLIGRARRVDILQGYSGYLVRPEFFDIDEVTRYDGAPPGAFFVDDVWFAACCRVQKFVYPGGRFCMDRLSSFSFFKSGSLGYLNRGGGNPENRNNTIVIRHFKERWMLHGKDPA